MKLYEFLEAVLYDKTEGKGKILTEELLQGKAKNTTEEYNLTFPPELNFSCKLPLHLKRYNGIVQMEMHGVSGDACAFGIEVYNHLLPEMFNTYLLDHIYGGHESALFF